MGYYQDDQNNLRQSLCRAQLFEPCGTRQCPTAALIDPVVIDILGDALLWRGYQTVVTQEGICEHKQLWIIRTRQSIDGSALPIFNAAPFAPKLPEIYKPEDTDASGP